MPPLWRVKAVQAFIPLNSPTELHHFQGGRLTQKEYIRRYYTWDFHTPYDSAKKASWQQPSTQPATGKATDRLADRPLSNRDTASPTSADRKVSQAKTPTSSPTLAPTSKAETREATKVADVAAQAPSRTPSHQPTPQATETHGGVQGRVQGGVQDEFQGRAQARLSRPTFFRRIATSLLRALGLVARPSSQSARAHVNSAVLKQTDERLMEQVRSGRETALINHLRSDANDKQVFHDALAHETSDNVETLLQKAFMASDEDRPFFRPDSPSYTTLPSWGEYQNNLRTLARMQTSSSPEQMKEAALTMAKVAARMTPSALNIKDNDLGEVSRNFREATNHLSYFLRACAHDKNPESARQAAHHFSAFAKSFDAGLHANYAQTGKMASESEKELMYDLTLDHALTNFSTKDRLALSAAMKKGNYNMDTVFSSASTGATPTKQSANYLASSLRRHSKTSPFLPPAGVPRPADPPTR